MEFIRKLLKLGGGTKAEPETMRGTAQVQSQDEQDATRSRMETEMASQREKRETPKPE